MDNKLNLGLCKICHTNIAANQDYVKLEEYIKGKKNSEAYYHRECFRDRMTGSKELIKLQNMAKNILEKANISVGNK